jgi:hypothetical protein
MSRLRLAAAILLRNIPGFILGVFVGPFMWEVALPFLQPSIEWAQSVLGAEDPAYDVRLSTAVPACTTGDVARIARDLDVRLALGADRLVICDDTQLTAPRSEFAREIAERYRGCLAYDGTIRPTLTLLRTSDAVCRAAYRFVGGLVMQSPPEQGVYVCLGGRGMSPGSRHDPVATEARACTEDELRRFGFLPL